MRFISFHFSYLFCIETWWVVDLSTTISAAARSYRRWANAESKARSKEKCKINTLSFVQIIGWRPDIWTTRENPTSFGTQSFQLGSRNEIYRSIFISRYMEIYWEDLLPLDGFSKEMLAIKTQTPVGLWNPFKPTLVFKQPWSIQITRHPYCRIAIF